MATWTMTVLNVWDEVQNIAQDSSARWGEPQRNALINSVCAQVAKDTRCLMQSASQNLVAGQANYAVPAACPGIAEVRRVYMSGNLVALVDGGELDRFERDGIVYNDGRPRWYPRDGEIQITPAPGANVANGLRVHYAGLPEAVSADGDAIPLPLDLQLAVVRGCAARVLSAEGDGEKTLYQEKLYREEVGRFLRKGGAWQERRQRHIIDEDEGIPRSVSIV